MSDCEGGGDTARCRAVGGGRKVEQLVAEYYSYIGINLGRWEPEKDDDDDAEIEVPKVHVSPIKQPDIEKKLKHAGLVLMNLNGMNLDKVEHYLTETLANSIPEDDRRGPSETEEHDRSSTIRLTH